MQRVAWNPIPVKVELSAAKRVVADAPIVAAAREQKVESTMEPAPTTKAKSPLIKNSEAMRISPQPLSQTMT